MCDMFTEKSLAAQQSSKSPSSSHTLTTVHSTGNYHILLTE